MEQSNGNGQHNEPSASAPTTPIQGKYKKEEILFQPKPFLKWVGGKRRLKSELIKRLPKTFERYYEPFLGGGALFFELRTSNAILIDTNRNLILTWIAIRDHIDALIAKLKIHQSCHSTEHYYDIRSCHNLHDPVDIAARLIYLNKTCFNGLYRVNRQGLFNVPIGRYSNPVICDTDVLVQAHIALQGVRIEHADFQTIKPGPNDFVYFDPPYAPACATSFVQYSKSGFSEQDHVELARLCQELDRQGTHIMLSNSYTPFTRKLFKKTNFRVAVVKAPRTVGTTTKSRQPVNEMIVTNY